MKVSVRSCTAKITPIPLTPSLPHQLSHLVYSEAHEKKQLSHTSQFKFNNKLEKYTINKKNNKIG